MLSGPKSRGVYDLTPQEHAFCVEYLHNGQNAKAAYLALHPDANSRQASQGGLNFRHRPQVDLFIRKTMRRQMKVAEITSERILQEMACLAFVDPADYLDEDGAAKPMSEIPEEARRAISNLEINELWEMAGRGKKRRRKYVGRLRKLGITNKMQALLALAKIKHMITDRLEVGATEDLAALLAKARKRKTRETTTTELEELFE